MSENILSEYLVKLGFKVDDTQYMRFTATMKGAAHVVESHTGGVVKNLLGWQTAVTGAFVAIGGGILGLADKVAMADQQYRLFGLHMFMSQDQAKGLKIAMDALGASMNDIAWDPELHGRFQVLMKDQEAMEKGLGGNFEDRMKSIRDIRFEFTRLHVEIEYGLMGTVNKLFEKLGLGSGGVLKKLQAMNDYIIAHLPQIQSAIANYLVPILKDVWGVFKDTVEVAKDFAVAFTQIVGALSNNQSLDSSTFSFNKFAEALKTVADWLKDIIDKLTWLEKKLSPFAGTIGFGIAGSGIGGAVGSVIGGIGGAAGGPLGIAAGAAGGGMLGSAATGIAGGAFGAVVDLYRHFHARKDRGFGDSDFGRLVSAVAMQESGNRQYDRNGNVITSSVGARGIMQLMPNTAAGMGLNPDDPAQNLRGGAQYLAQMIQQFGGSVQEGLMAYNWGPGKLHHALATGAPIPPGVEQYAHSIMARAGMQGDVHIQTVNIHVPDGITDRKDAQQFVAESIRVATGRQTQRNLTQVAAGAYY